MFHAFLSSGFSSLRFQVFRGLLLCVHALGFDRVVLRVFVFWCCRFQCVFYGFRVLTFSWFWAFTLQCCMRWCCTARAFSGFYAFVQFIVRPLSQYSVVHCQFIAVHCISLAVNCQFMEVHWQLIAVHCQFIAVHGQFIVSSLQFMVRSLCSSLTVHCSSLSVHCRPLSVHCQFIAVPCQFIAVHCQFIASSLQFIAVHCQFIAVHCQWVSSWSSRVLPGLSWTENRKKKKLLGVTLFETKT